MRGKLPHRRGAGGVFPDGFDNELARNGVDGVFKTAQFKLVRVGREPANLYPDFSGGAA